LLNLSIQPTVRLFVTGKGIPFGHHFWGMGPGRQIFRIAFGKVVLVPTEPCKETFTVRTQPPSCCWSVSTPSWRSSPAPLRSLHRTDYALQGKLAMRTLQADLFTCALVLFLPFAKVS
jgi:hypothetical protein